MSVQYSQSKKPKQLVPFRASPKIIFLYKIM